YYRFVIAFDVRTGGVRWARAMGPEDPGSVAGPGRGADVEAARRAQASLSAYDIESVTALPRAVVLIRGDGRVRALDPDTGAVLATQDLGVQIGAIATDLRGYRPPAQGAPPPARGGGREQMVELIRDPDSPLGPV